MKGLETKIGNVTLKNPLMPASGCFGFGHEMMERYDLNILGALVSKSVTKDLRKGNAGKRIASVIWSFKFNRFTKSWC